MKIAVMQPYFFPYIGYFELIKSVDVFVFLSNVQYTRGWINRNRIRSSDVFQYLTVPISKCSRSTNIKDVKISYNKDWTYKHLSTLKHVYGIKVENHPIYCGYKDLISNKIVGLNELNQFCIKLCCDYLEIKTTFLESVDFIDSINSTQRILNICNTLNVKEYVNAVNGRHLYDQKDFKDIKLTFMEPTKHLNKLSILDLCFGDNIKLV